jgi:hypothetical protein
MGAVLNQRPALFGLALLDVGLLDMLRFQLFGFASAWCAEYGCSDNETHFRNLLTYSPIHNVRGGVDYPPMLVSTADHDDRVVPSHSFKYVAELHYAVGASDVSAQKIMFPIHTFLLSSSFMIQLTVNCVKFNFVFSLECPVRALPYFYVLLFMPLPTFS